VHPKQAFRPLQVPTIAVARLLYLQAACANPAKPWKNVAGHGAPWRHSQHGGARQRWLTPWSAQRIAAVPLSPEAAVGNAKPDILSLPYGSTMHSVYLHSSRRLPMKGALLAVSRGASVNGLWMRQDLTLPPFLRAASSASMVCTHCHCSTSEPGASSAGVQLSARPRGFMQSAWQLALAAQAAPPRYVCSPRQSKQLVLDTQGSHTFAESCAEVASSVLPSDLQVLRFENSGSV